MAINKEVLGPQNSEEEEAFAIEALVFSVQIALQRAMQRRGVSNKDLAERLGMTPARVSQIFSAKGANLTLRTIARVQHALGEEFEYIRKKDIRTSLSPQRVVGFKPVVVQGNPSVWKEHTAHNLNKKFRPAAA